MRRPLLLAVGLALAAAAPAHAQDPEPPPPPPEPPVIAEGVTIASVAVGGLTQEQATAAVGASFDRRLVYRLRERTFRVAPGELGARARIHSAVREALAALEGTAVGLEVVVSPWRLKRWINQRARRFNRPARDARLLLRDARPWIRSHKPGRRLAAYPARLRLKAALVRHLRGPVRLPVRGIRPKVTRWSFGPVVVIRRGSRRLYLYRGMRAGGRMKLRRSFPVAVGQPSYPTPLGRFRIVSMQRNPWWYPPSASWASGASPIPPGPGNPLGTRWMGLSVGAVGIHGTYNAASIGGFASHGCIRMLISHSEWLFERVRIGTTVFIVGA